MMSQGSVLYVQYTGENQEEVQEFAKQACTIVEDGVIIETAQGGVELEHGDCIVQLAKGYQVVSSGLMEAIEKNPDLEDLDWGYFVQQLFYRSKQERLERNPLFLALWNLF